VPLTPVEQLGKNILYDSRLSNPPGYACATCHVPAAGDAGPSSIVNEFDSSMPGIRAGRFGNRKPQPYLYAAFCPTGPVFYPVKGVWIGGDFWDGRVPDLSGQARQPFVNPNEMANTPVGPLPPVAGGYSPLVVQKVKTGPYASLFKKVYGKNAFKNYSVADLYTLITEAIAAYESSGEVNPFSSKYDASQYGTPPQNLYTLTASEERGRQLYFGTYVRPGGTPVNA
jgi:cytochrome c peroxidase